MPTVSRAAASTEASGTSREVLECLAQATALASECTKLGRFAKTAHLASEKTYYLPSHPLLNEALQDVLVGREQRPTEAASAEHLDLA